MKYGYLLLCLLAFIPSLTFAERIQTFSTNIDLRDDGSFLVTERIEYVFTEDRHDIFRYIPTKHSQEATKWYKERYIDIDVRSVTMDGGSVPFEVSKEDEQVSIKIGDPNSTINGVHTYEIEYLVEGGLSFFAYVGAELYWNVTGEEWGIPILSVEVSVSAPEGVFVGERTCYRGSRGSTVSCSRISDENGRVVFRAANLNPNEGVTMALTINETKVEKVILEKNKILIFLIPLGVLWLFFLGYFVYRFSWWWGWWRRRKLVN